MSVMAFVSRSGRRLYSTVIPGRAANPESRDSGSALRASRNDGASRSAIYLQRGDKRFLRDVDLAELPHLLLALLLLLQKFALARDVAAVALCGDVLAQRAHGFAGDHLAADRGLDRNLEHVRRDQFLHLLDHGAAAAFGALAVHQHRQSVHRLGVGEGLHVDEVGGVSRWWAEG